MRAGDGPHDGPSAGPGVDFAAVFEAVSTPYVLLDAGLHILAANPAYLASTGRDLPGLLGRHLFEAFPPTPDAAGEDGLPKVQTALERISASGRAEQLPLIKYDITDQATGALVERYWLLTGDPVLDADGATVLIAQRTDDVTEFMQAREHGRRSAERDEVWRARLAASEADLFVRARQLTAALEAKDVAATRLARTNEVALQLTAAASVEDLERIVVGHGLGMVGADGGAVISQAPGGSWRITPSAEFGEQVRADYADAPFDSPLPGCWSARTGRPLLLPTRASGLAYDPVMARVYADTDRGGWAFLPLIVSGRSVGCLAVAWHREHTVDPGELVLLEGFAAQCAQALDRIQIAAAREEAARAVARMSETLQRSLLAQPSPPESVRIAVRYQPAAHEAQIGGDWYDAFTTAAGHVLLVVGDIAGHDRTAAALMGQVRNLLRGMAYDRDDDPATLLTRLDRALHGLELDTLATAVLAKIENAPDESGGRRLSWCNAGHLPPLRRRPDGRVEILTSPPQLLLGLDPATDRAERLLDLEPGSTLVLYTDGLVERRTGSLDEDIARLAALVERHGADDPETLADRLLATMVGENNDDDTALLILQTSP